MATTVNNTTPKTSLGDMGLPTNVSAEPIEDKDQTTANTPDKGATTKGVLAKGLGNTDSLSKEKADPFGIPWDSQVLMPPVGGDAHAAIAQHFEPLASDLSPPSGPVGQAFSPDTSETPSLPFAPLPSSAAHAPKAKEPAIAKTPVVQNSLQLVDQLTSRLLQIQTQKQMKNQSDSAASQAQFGQWSPRAQALFTQAAGHIAQAMAAQRAFSESKRVNETKAPKKSKNAMEIDSADTADAATSASTDIEIPSPAVTQLEQAVQSIKGGLQEQAKSDGIAWLDPSAFKGGDIMALASIVMMEGCQVQDDILSDMLQQVQSENQQKDTLRQLYSQGKTNEADLTQQIDGEFSDLSAKGLIHQGVTLTQYTAWRQLSYGNLTPTFDAQKNMSYAFGTPQLGPEPTAATLPGWIMNGTTAGTGSGSATTSTQYGVPANLLAALSDIYTKSGQSGSFDEWLQGTVGLIPAGTAAEAADNCTQLQNFVDEYQGNPNALAPAAAANAAPSPQLAAAEKDALALGKIKCLQQSFSGLINSDDVDDDTTTLGTDLTGLSPADAAAYQKWLSDSSSKGFVGQISKYQTKVEKVAATVANPANWDLDIPNCQFSDVNGSITCPDGGKNDKNGDAYDDGQWLQVQQNNPHPTASQISLTVAGTDTGTSSVATEGTSVNGWLEAFGCVVGLPTLGVNGQAPKGTWSLAYKLAKKPTPASTADITSIFKDIGDSPADVDQIGVDQLKGDPFNPADPGSDFQATGATSSDAAPTPLQSAFTTLVGYMSSDGDPTKGTWFDTIQQVFPPASASGKATAPASGPTAPPTDANGLVLNQTGNLAAYEASLQTIQDKLDSLNSMTDIDQMKVQSLMDERSKMLETLSNMLKSDADLSKTLRDNLK